MGDDDRPERGIEAVRALRKGSREDEGSLNTLLREMWRWEDWVGIQVGFGEDEEDCGGTHAEKKCLCSCGIWIEM